MGAYDRLAAAKFRDHKCEADASPAVKKETTTPADNTFSDRAQALIKRGYRPKVAVELVLQEIEMEHGHSPRLMEKAQADAEAFLVKMRQGTI